MATYTGTANNDSWNLITPGTFTLDGLGGVDTLNLGTSLRSSYNITKTADGTVHIDSISGASAALHATLLNMEVLTFNSGRDTLDLRTYFGVTPPPTVSISDNAAGTAIGNVTYSLAFSEAVTGLIASGFTVASGSVVSVSGSGAAWSVVVAPAAATEGTLNLTLNAGAVSDASGNTNAATAAAAQAIDTKAPTVSSYSPAAQASAVATNSDIVLSFSEAIQRGTGSVTLTAGGNVVATYDAASSGNLTISGATLTIHPASGLGPLTGYTVQLAAGSVKDLAGNAYASSSSYGFTTGAGAVFAAPIGNATITGGAGIDTLVLSGNESQYQLSQSGGATQITGAQGTDTLASVERLHFADKYIALDTSGDAGQAYRLYQAAFNRVPDVAGLGYWINAMDNGQPLISVAQGFIGSGEFTTAYGALNNADFVGQLYLNVLHRPGESAGALWWQQQLDSGAYTRQAVLAGFSESAENQAALIGAIQHGITYVL